MGSKGLFDFCLINHVMLPPHSAGHPGNYILLFLNCADSSPPTLVKLASLFNRAGKAGFARHLPVKLGKKSEMRQQRDRRARLSGQGPVSSARLFAKPSITVNAKR
jgi:hypothetical protein